MDLMKSEIKLKKRQLILFFLAVFLAGSLMGNVNARGDVFVIEPMQEVTESVEFTLSDVLSADVSGNMSVIDGFIDFYVTSPSGKNVLYYNKTTFTSFNFIVMENGTYTLHLANTWSANNVTATLNYGVNFKVTLAMNVGVKHDVTPQTVYLTPSPFINWSEILRILGILGTISTILSFGVALGKWASKLRRRYYWRKKHGKSKTPVVISLIDKIVLLYMGFLKVLNV